MNITVTLTANPEFLKVLEGIVKAFAPQTIPATNGKKVPGAAAVAKEEKIETPPVDTPVVSNTTETTPAPKVEGITLEVLRAAVRVKAQAGKRDDVKKLLSEFGADKVTNLRQDQYADFHAKIEAL
jgi:hypothetical protein